MNFFIIAFMLSLELFVCGIQIYSYIIKVVNKSVFSTLKAWRLNILIQYRVCTNYFNILTMKSFHYQLNLDNVYFVINLVQG